MSELKPLKPWYQVVTPREDLRENRPLDASEFAVHLDHIREKRAHADYVEPKRFFDRTYMTRSLLDLSSQVIRRLSGIQVETSAVFNMATQFGGGKTHSLSALYHLAKAGNGARAWKGVDSILLQADVPEIPRADVAVFVGTEFDVVDGRGGDGEPRRKTPWGEIAWQLGGEALFAAVADHDERGIAPAGDTLRRMLPDGPTLILVDELLNYVSRSRKTGLGAQLYNFMQTLSEEARARNNLVLCVSIPASEIEMNPEDQRDYEAYKHLLERLGKAISMASETEVNEIIRRRLFDWGGIPTAGKETARAYADWARDHASDAAGLGGEGVNELFESCYPFHPTVISVFERKWQSLPRFQRTRGILRLLALWVAWAYQEQHRKNSREPLITLGSAPLEDQTFRDALFEQLGSDQLSVPVATDIAGKSDAHAVQLDREATDAIKKARLHQRVASSIFFESNGGQSQTKMEASLPEIRAAVGGPGINLADIETVIEGLSATCFYLNSEHNRYRFGLRPNLNQMLVTRRGAVKKEEIDDRIQKITMKLFSEGPKGLDRRFFPTKTGDVPDRPVLSLVVLDGDHQAFDSETPLFIEGMVREAGTSGRTFKSGLLFAAVDDLSAVIDAARNLLAWEDIEEDADSVRQLEEAQRRTLTQSLKRAEADLREAIWRGYRYIFLLGKDNAVKRVDLGNITSSMAPTICDLIINSLMKDDEITASLGHSTLARIWPPALTEWSTKALRDAFFASPALPRLFEPESIKRTIADGVTSGSFGYAIRTPERRLRLERFGESLSEAEVEISEDVFILRPDDAKKLKEPPHLDSLVIYPASAEVGPGEHVTFKVSGLDQYGHAIEIGEVTWLTPNCSMTPEGMLIASDNQGLYIITARSGGVEAEAQVRVIEKAAQGGPERREAGGTIIQWSGEIPPRKWTTFYTKVISKIANTPGLTLRVSFEAPAEEGTATSKVEEIKAALRDLGLDEDVKI